MKYSTRLVLGGLASLALAAIGVTWTSSPALGDSGCATATAATLVSGFYEIDSPAKLQWLKDSGVKSDSYKLTANINMSGCTWTNGIGSNATPFSGTFNGNGKSISNLTVNGSSYVGLFSYVTGTITDLTLTSPSVSASSQMAGALVGDLRASGSVSNVTLTNVSVFSTSQYAGGAIAYVKANSSVSNVSVSGTVSSPQGVGGGVAATIEGSVTGVTSSATVTGSFNLGGIAGSVNNAGSVTDSTATGNVTGTSSQVGGAVGSAAGTRPTCGTMTGVSASGRVEGTSYVGGVLGYGNCYYIYQSSSSSTVVATSAGTFAGAGGIAGYDNFGGRIEKSFFTGSVTGSEVVGGVAGLSRSIIVDSYSTGTVTATLATNGGRAGGVVGQFRNSGGAGEPNAELTRSYARGLVTPPSGGSSTTGGLVGEYYSGTITASIWDKDTTGRSTSQGGSGATGYTSQQMKDFVLYDADNLNWGNITDGISSGNGVTSGTTWSICSGANSGYPFLTRESRSGTCRPTMAYNGNTNTAGSAPTDSGTPYAVGDTVTVVGNTGNMTKTSRIFAGWNTKADGTGTSYVEGDTFTISAPVMLFAVWVSSPQITYSANGGTGTVAATTAASGATVTLSTGSGFTRTGFTLSRWDTSSLGTGTSYSKGQSVTMPAGGLSLHAVWTALPAVTYNANLGSGSIATQYAASGASVILNSGNNFTRSGFTLSRWDTSSAGTGTPYSKSQVITMPAGGLSLYAVWVADPTTTTSTTTTSTTATSTTSTVAPSVRSNTESSATTLAGSPTTAPSAVISPLVSGSPLSSPSSTVRSTTTSPASTSTIDVNSADSNSTTTTSPSDSENSPDVEEVGPGETGATVGGQPTEVVVTVQDGSLVVAVADATVRYSVVSASGVKRLVSSGSILTVAPDDKVTVDFAGFAATSNATAWITPGDQQLGSVTLADGAGSVSGVVPVSVTPGERRLVVTAESGNGDPVVIAYGVAVSNDAGSSTPWSRVFIVILGLAIIAGLILPAARRRRDDDEK